MKQPFCKKCDLVRGGRYCYKCGTKLVEAVTVCLCGHELDSVDSFCEECGRPRPQKNEKEGNTSPGRDVARVELK